MTIRDGAILSPHDTRDYVYKQISVQINSMSLLPKVDLRNIDQYIRDQGQLGACTAFSSSAARQILFAERAGASPTLSPAFIYYFSRLIAYNNVNQDSGCYLRAVMKAWQKYGCCPEVDFPYTDQTYNITPHTIAIQNALNFRINRYYRALDLFDIKVALNHGLPVVIAINTNLIGGVTYSNGMIYNPGQNTSYTGSHALVVVGYYDHPNYPGGGYLVVKNSWGINWGNQGYFYMAYQYVNDPNWFGEAWVMEA